MTPREKLRAKGEGGIKSWPEGERPREKALRRGIQSLSDAELLAVLIRTGTRGKSAIDLGRQLLGEGRSLRALMRMTPHELMRTTGIGMAKAVHLLAAFESGRRASACEGDGPVVVRGPADVAGLLQSAMRDLKHEEFRVVLLDARNAVLHVQQITSGTLNASLVHAREVFKPAVDRLAASVVVVHNHPSGNPEPSREDLEVTRGLAEAGRILGIPLHDHLIIAGSTYTSLAERGLL